MKGFLKNIWKDSVFSNVIAVGLVALLTLMYNLIKSIIEKTSFGLEFSKFWTRKIELWVILLFLIIIIGFLIIRKIKTFNYTEGTLNLDKAFFNRLRNELLTPKMMLSPKTNEFSSNPFKWESLGCIFELLEESKKADFEFINPKLEKIKKSLVREIDNLSSITTSYIFGTHNGGWLSIPKEWKYEKRVEAMKAIAKQENLLTEEYEKLIKTGRRILKI